MARLSELGQLALGHGDGVVSLGNATIDRGGEVGWLTSNVLIYQRTAGHNDIMAYHVTTNTYQPLDPTGAHNLRAGAGVWAAFFDSAVRTSWGHVYGASRLCDVSDRGDVVVCPLNQDHVFVFPPHSPDWTTSIATGPLGQDATAGINVRLRSGLLLFQGAGVWSLYDIDATAWVNIAPRTEVIDYAVPIRLDEPWLLERGNGRLTLRPATETHGYELFVGNTFSPDAVRASAKVVMAGWSAIQGEPVGAGHVVTQNVSLPRIDLNDLPPPVVVEPVIPSYERFVYTGACDASSTQYGYHSTPGNCEVLVRDVDLSKRKRPDLPVVAVWQIAERVGPLLGVWHDSGGASGPIANARRVADAKGVPVVVYYDGRQTPPQSVRDQVRHGDGLAVNGYPRDDEDAHETFWRVAQTVHDVTPMMFVRPLYTQSGNWPLQDILDLQTPYTLIVGHTQSIKIDAWFACAPVERGGMLAHPEFMRVGEGLEAAVVVEPENEEHMAAYGQPMKGFKGGTLESHPQGAQFRAVRMDNGKILCCTPDGNLEERTDKGGWEAFELSANGSSLIATRDKDGKVVYVLPWV